jgi:hypothetical protein
LTQNLYFKDLNIWSENNWTEFAKQFNKLVEFPLPGQVGVVCELKKESFSDKKIKNSAQQKLLDKQFKENLRYILYKPLLQEKQAVKLQEAAQALAYEKIMENELFSAEESNFTISKKNFELKAYKCPVSLIKGINRKS